LGTGSLIIDNATDHTNDGTGVSQQMQALSNENIAAASLAEHETNQYIDSLATLGNDFKRVVTNWNSLQAIGAPIESGRLSWDPSATSFYLRYVRTRTSSCFVDLNRLQPSIHQTIATAAERSNGVSTTILNRP
jgi:hypothetical protein